MSDEQPIGELSNGDLVWPGPTYLIRIHGDPDRYVDSDICDVIEGHYNVLARLEPERRRRLPSLKQFLERRRQRREEASYQRYIDSLEPCPGCGRVDEMDNIEGRLLCAACSLDEHDDDEWGGFYDEGSGYDEELRS